MMRPHDDTHVNGQILNQAGLAVGALCGATFDITPDDHGSYTISMRAYFSHPQLHMPKPDAERISKGFSRFVLPCLLDDRDNVIELPEMAVALGHRYALVMLIRDTNGHVRAAGTLLVECRNMKAAQRKLEQIRAMSQ